MHDCHRHAKLSRPHCRCIIRHGKHIRHAARSRRHGSPPPNSANTQGPPAGHAATMNQRRRGTFTQKAHGDIKRRIKGVVESHSSKIQTTHSQATKKRTSLWVREPLPGEELRRGAAAPRRRSLHRRRNRASPSPPATEELCQGDLAAGESPGAGEFLLVVAVGQSSVEGAAGRYTGGGAEPHHGCRPRRSSLPGDLPAAESPGGAKFLLAVAIGQSSQRSRRRTPDCEEMKQREADGDRWKIIRDK
jgi:hypothetical protein